MKRVAGALMVLMVIVLVAASSPSSDARGPLSRAAQSAQSNPPGTPTAEVGAEVAATATPQALPTGTPEPTIEPENVALARLKAKQESALARGAAVALPKRILIPAIGVDAGFEFVGLAADGSMDVPKDPNQVAWYRLGPRPGERGNAILAGHVDWDGRMAVFWGLKDLQAGDLIEVVAADDKKYEFVVQWKKWYGADTAPVEDVFRQAEIGEITLITCGGEFDRKRRQYLSRLVVRGVLR